MQIVVKITEDLYTQIKDNVLFANSIPSDIRWDITDAIVHGAPLPEGHGRIADVDKILDEMRATKTYDILFALERVKPIIEADKE